jgi:hypothetical protein
MCVLDVAGWLAGQRGEMLLHHLGDPSQQGKKTQPILCYILQEKDFHHHENLAHKRVLTKHIRLAPKKGAHFSQDDVLAEISKLTLEI